MSSPEASSSSEDEFDLSATSVKASTTTSTSESSSSATAKAKAAAASSLFSDEEDEDDEEDAPSKPDANDSKKKAVAAGGGGSSDDEDQTKGKGKDMEDLFGSDYDSEEEEFKASGIKESPVREENRVSHQQDSYPEDHGVSHGGSSHSNEIWLPKTPKAPKSASYFICKMPNILRLVPDAYTKEAIDEEMQNPSDETLYRNYVRWRYQRDETTGKVKIDTKTGQPLREANTKLVQWEDGSLTMFVGKEALNLSRHKLPNSFLFVNEISSDKPELDDDLDGAAGGQETVLECHGRLKEKITIRPTTTSSKSHKSLTMSMRAKHNKGVQKIKTYISELDGEREQEQRAKINDDKLRLQNRKKARQTHEEDRGRSSRMDAGFLEEDYDGGEYDDEDNVGAIKEQFGQRKNKNGNGKRPATGAGGAAAAGRRPSAASSFRGDGFDEYSKSRAREAARSDSEQDQAEDDDEEDDFDDDVVVRSVKKRRTVDEEEDSE